MIWSSWKLHQFCFDRYIIVLSHESSWQVQQRYPDIQPYDFSWYKQSEQFHFPATTIHGDQGYNDDKCLQLTQHADMEFLNTTKRGPSLAFKFSITQYNTSQEQIEIPENGPVLSLGAIRSVDNVICDFVSYGMELGESPSFEALHHL